MNFLAHLLLADDTPASRVGNLLPDLHRGRLPADLPPEVLMGVRRHRRVDAFTDRHRAFAQSVDRLRPRHGRYAGIIADVIYDHALSINWSMHHRESLPRFIHSCYQDLLAYEGPLPDEVVRVHRMMATQDWLGEYATLAGIERILIRMAVRLRRRFNRDLDLATAVVDLEEHTDAFAAEFEWVFADLLQHLELEPRVSP